MKCSALLQVKSLLVLLLGFQLAYSQAQPRCTQDARVGLANGETTVVNCLDDDENRTFRLRSRPLTAAFAYLFTDENDIVIDISTQNFLDLESYGPGTFRVYSFSYIGKILIQPGQNATTTELAEFCYGLSANFLQVINLSPDGGEISTSDGEVSLFTCPGDGNPDVVTFANNSNNPFYSYVITNEQNDIISLPEGNSADFEGAGAGICRVWGIAHLEEINLEVGQNIAAISLDNDCSSLSSNFIEVVRLAPDGGTVALDDGAVSTNVCLSPNGSQTLTFSNVLPQDQPFSFLVTDEQNIILEVLPGNTKTFTTESPGICRVWGVAYTGQLIAQPGQNAATAALSDDCFDLSDNFVEVIRRVIEGGEVSLADGTVSSLICVNDAVPDVLEFINNSEASDNYTYIITDASGIILEAANGNSADFENAGPGICRVYGLAYSGTLNVNAGIAISEAIFSEECFALSDNSIEVVRQEPAGGTISFADGTTAAAVCVGDGLADALTPQVTGNVGENFAYITTDENNNILVISETGIPDFENTDPGVCRVWGLAYFGEITAAIGDALEGTALADKCFDLTDNFLEVTRTLIDGGSVSLVDGATQAAVCVNDGRADELTFANSSAAQESYAYLVTDSEGRLLNISESGVVDFDQAPAGDCRVYGVSFQGNLTIAEGQNVTEFAISDICFELSTNFVTINRTQISGGQVALEDGTTTTYTCPGDGREDVINFTFSNADGENFAYLITDENNTILEISTTGSQDFEGAPAGICRVWGFAFTGNITAQAGDIASEVALSDDCYDLSDNFIEVIRMVPEGGTVAMPDGATAVTTCPNDGVADVISFDSAGVSNTPFTYVITNEDNIVLGIPTGDSNDFDTAPAGVCRVWGVAYTGNLFIVPGDNILVSFLSDDCFDVSENFIEVRREIPSGGTFALADGTASVTTCPNDVANELTIALDGQEGSSYSFLLLDANSTVVAIAPASGQTGTLDVNPFGPGTFTLVGLAYNGDLNIGIGDVFDALSSTLTTGCWDVSQSTITVNAIIPDAGSIMVVEQPALDSIITCGGSGIGDVISFASSAADNGSKALILTDENDIIVQVVMDSAVDFGDVESGTTRVRQVSYTGDLTASVGESIATSTLSSDCFDVTDNFITILNTKVDGGSIGSELVQSNDNIFICSDGNPDVIAFTTTSTAGDSEYQFIITTEDNITLALIEGNEQDFEGTGFDELRVWGVSYSGNLSFSPGLNIEEAQLSDACFVLSENFLNIISDEPEGGSISTAGGETTLVQCVGAVPDVLALATTSTSQSGYGYLLTDTNNVVISVHESDGIDFRALPVETYRIWGLSFTGTINDIIGSDAAAVELASGCFELSANFIEVFRAPAIDGGTLSILFNEGDVTYTCPGDGISDLVIVETTSEDLNYRFTITDTNNIVRIPNPGTNVINFEGAGVGTWRIYGIAFNGDLDIGFGDNVLESTLSDSCWVLSSNFITVVNEVPEGGSVSTTDGATEVTVTVGDGIDDIVPFFRENAGPSLYTYVITDENNEIIGYVDGDSQNFEAAGEGICRVWGLSYTGTLIAQAGENAAEVALSDDCFDLSDNFITVTRVAGGAGLAIQAEQFQENLINVDAPIEISISPNPVVSELKMVFEIQHPTREETEVLLYNINGQLIKSMTHATFAGHNELIISVKHLASGIYLLAARNGNQLQMKRFAKN